MGANDQITEKTGLGSCRVRESFALGLTHRPPPDPPPYTGEGF